MMPYKNRLIKKEDFEEVHRNGKFFYFGNIALKMKKNRCEETRIGFSIGLNFSKKAVERNKVKRQLRNIFHKYFEKIKKGVDIVVIVKKGEGQNIDWKDLILNVEKVLKEANLINNKN